ncbi:antiviral reverse transcriptase Drt3b [Paraburkholderia sp. GAS82]|uniref:antiviral reverse transcriptase Drt3b n=1 Tax=Paraburkholderia sp. GAS82 TaxID=3035137 RepID=UPI003D1982A9
MTKVRRLVAKEDYARVLLTETSSFDVPVTFSNVGFYWHWKKHEEGKSFFPEIMDFLFNEQDLTEYTIPLPYKMRKDSESYRSLALIHPGTQIKFVKFYKTFDQQILLSCKESPFSIRCPDAVASKYYAKNEEENRYKYRSESVTTRQAEAKSRYLTSYFSYRGYTRLHHFFDSTEFLALERKYSSFWSIDIARCFDSIYTHSVTWALKTKAYSKYNANVKNTFGSIFDSLMQRSNYNETAGIIIGPETSRIFSEIIFQTIDRNILSDLKKKGLENNVDYTIRRYVDDIFIFSTSEEISNEILKTTDTCLKAYKLNLNAGKTVKAARPFITEKSRALQLAKKSFSALVGRLTGEKDSSCVDLSMPPKKIFNRRRLIVAFLTEVKSACIGSAAAYEMVSGYMISALSNLLISFVEGNRQYQFAEDESKSNHVNFFLIVVELIFHFYTISPSQNGSVKICIIADLACGYADNKMEENSNEIKSLIYTLANSFFESSGFRKISKDNSDFALLEALNILTALKLLGRQYLVSRSVLQKIVDLSDDRKMSYFEITSLLFYIGDDLEKSYKKIKERVLKEVDSILSNLSDLRINSEKIYLLLDILACPFVDDAKRKELTLRLLKLVRGKVPSNHEVLEKQKQLAKYRWFTSWNRAELLSTLEKKALLRTY